MKKRMKLSVDAPPSAWSHKTHIVASHEMRRELERHAPALSRLARSSGWDQMGKELIGKDTDDWGWREYLAARVESITGRKRESVLRHIHRVMSGESKVVAIDLADAYMLACGVYLHETPIKTLPGNRANAEEMVLIRAEAKGLQLSPEEVLHRVNVLLRYQVRVVYPEGYEMSHITQRYKARRQAREKAQREARRGAA